MAGKISPFCNSTVKIYQVRINFLSFGPNKTINEEIVTTFGVLMNINKRIFNSIIVSFLGLSLLASCSDPQFGSSRGQLQEQTPGLKTSSSSMCSDFTLVRPQVDLLFLWDNSSSSVFINNKTKNALNSIVNKVSQRFDYHIMLAPLLSTGSVNSDAKLVTYDTAGLNSSAMNMRINRSQAANALNFPSASGNLEAGLERSRQILASNISNGVFRQGAYTIVVLMSTEDDNSYVSGNYISSSQRRDYVDEKVHQLLCLRGNYNGSYGSNCSGPSLNSSMMRFISIVANNSNRCSQNGVVQNANAGVAYEMASSFIYSQGYTNSNPNHFDQNGARTQNRGSESYPLYDSTDICNGDYNGIFDGVNSVIQDRVIAHKYRYWPVAGPVADVDSNTIEVKSSNGQQLFHLPPSATHPNDDGFKYIGNTTRNTRYQPSPGEPHTGHLIELYGNARVTYPECLKVSFTQNEEYYGHVHLTGRPLESSIELKINGVNIPMCSSASSCSNGYVFLNTPSTSTRNIKIVSPSDHSPDIENPDTRTGYFLKLFGNAVYSNGDNVNVNWLPSSGN